MARPRSLTDRQVVAVRKLRRAGMTLAGLAKKFGVVPQTIYHYLHPKARTATNRRAAAWARKAKPWRRAPKRTQRARGRTAKRVSRQ